MNGTLYRWQSVISQNHPTEGLEFKDFKIQIYFWLNKMRSVDFLLLKGKGAEQIPQKQVENGA